MTTKKTDSSAARNNRPQNLSNDVSDSGLVARVFATAGHAHKVEMLMDAQWGVHIARQVENAFALAEASPETWRAFTEDDFWTAGKQRPGIDDQQSAPRFVFRIYFSEHASGAKRASELWTAVQQLLHEDFTYAQVIAEFNKGLGKEGMDLKAVCRRAADRRRLSKPAKANSTKAKSAAKAIPAVAKTKKSSADTNGSPSTQKPATLIKPVTDGAAMDSLRLHFPDGMDDFTRLQKGKVVVVTMKILDLAKGGYTAEFLKMRSKKPK